jgi:hypothetical protein
VITPGAYALTGYVQFQSDTYPTLGGRIWQTLYVGASSALLISDDGNNFHFRGTYTYSIEDNRIVFVPSCESSLARYRAFPGAATFSATGTILEFFDETRRVRSTFQRID